MPAHQQDNAEYLRLNKANWNERAPKHAQSTEYAIDKFLSDPAFISSVVEFDRPLLGDISGLTIVHLQCHIGTDTLSLARRGAASVVGLDFSGASILEARNLAARAEGGERVRYLESDVYDAPNVLKNQSFDLVFTGIGALCWLPDIKAWAATVAALLKPGTGRLFIREAHPILWAIDEKVQDRLVLRYPYFEMKDAVVFDDEGTTYVEVDGGTKFVQNKTAFWNHGIGEIVQALLDVGMCITGLVEHQSLPWEALPGQMVKDEHGESMRQASGRLIDADMIADERLLAHGRERIPLSYTLQARKQ